MVIEINNKSYNAYDLNATYAYCWNDRGYPSEETSASTRCLPDTANPSYQWGFSTMLLGIFVIIQFFWALSMYAVWQDAQLNSKLVKSGFRLTELATAFVLTEAAKKKAELEVGELIRCEQKELTRKLYGTRKKEGAVIDKDMFCDEGDILRKRTVSEHEREV
jgi:hypothetical protein